MKEVFLACGLGLALFLIFNLTNKVLYLETQIKILNMQVNTLKEIEFIERR